MQYILLLLACVLAETVCYRLVHRQLIALALDKYYMLSVLPGVPM